MLLAKAVAAKQAGRAHRREFLVPAWSRGHRAATWRRRSSENTREFSTGRSVCWLVHTPTGSAAVCPALPDGNAALFDEWQPKWPAPQRPNAANGADAPTHTRTWHQTSKAQKHRKRAVSRVPSCLLSTGRSRSIRRSDGRTSGHWNIWVWSVLSARATGARPFWVSAPCRAIAWGPTALTALRLRAGWQGQKPPRLSCDSCRNGSRTFLALNYSQRSPRQPRDGDLQVGIAASRPTLSCPDRTLTVPALVLLVRGS